MFDLCLMDLISLHCVVLVLVVTHVSVSAIHTCTSVCHTKLSYVPPMKQFKTYFVGTPLGILPGMIVPPVPIVCMTVCIQLIRECLNFVLSLSFPSSLSQPPWYSRNTAEMYDGILNQPLRLRMSCSSNAKAFMKGVSTALLPSQENHAQPHELCMSQLRYFICMPSSHPPQTLCTHVM